MKKFKSTRLCLIVALFSLVRHDGTRVGTKARKARKANYLQRCQGGAELHVLPHARHRLLHAEERARAHRAAVCVQREPQSLLLVPARRCGSARAREGPRFARRG